MEHLQSDNPDKYTKVRVTFDNSKRLIFPNAFRALAASIGEQIRAALGEPIPPMPAMPERFPCGDSHARELVLFDHVNRWLRQYQEDSGKPREWLRHAMVSERKDEYLIVIRQGL
jgi:hypothetical protein